MRMPVMGRVVRAWATRVSVMSSSSWRASWTFWLTLRIRIRGLAEGIVLEHKRSTYVKNWSRNLLEMMYMLLCHWHEAHQERFLSHWLIVIIIICLWVILIIILFKIHVLARKKWKWVRLWWRIVHLVNKSACCLRHCIVIERWCKLSRFVGIVELVLILHLPHFL